MYQVIGDNGVPGPTVDLATIKEMAENNIIQPWTPILDCVNEITQPASHMFIEDGFFLAKKSDGKELAPATVAVAVPEAPPITAFPSVSQLPITTQVTTTVTVSSNVQHAPAVNPQNQIYPQATALPVTVSGYEDADLFQRFIGLFIDNLIVIPFIFLSEVPLLGLFTIPLICVYYISRDAFFGGQSIGKRIAKTRVIRLDGQPFTYGCSVARNIVYFSILFWMLPFLGLMVFGLTGCGLGFVETLMVLITGRRIGDHICGTKVVKA